MDEQFLVEQAFEESRYHRRFHHTVWTLFVTLYVAFIGFQISSPSSIIAIRSNPVQTVAVVGILFILVPGYLWYVFLKYHKTIAVLNSLIARMTLSSSLVAELVRGEDELQKGLDQLLFKKYEEVLAGNISAMSIGRGHWFFLGTLSSLVICNLVLFLAA